MNLLILILKITITLALVQLGHIRVNRNVFDINDNSNINSNKINNKIVNLSNNIKKMSYKAGFFIFKASLVFTQLRKTFIKALILYYFNLVYYI